MTAQVTALTEAQHRTETEVRGLAEALLRTEGQVARLTQAMQTLTNDVGELKGKSLEADYRVKGPAYFSRIVRRPHVLTPDELTALVEDARDSGVLSGVEAQEIYEAAAIDGASPWRRFRNVTLPLLSPVIFFSLIIGIIGTMQSGFTTTYLFTGAQSGSGSTDSGGPDNALLLMFLYIYHQGFVDFNMGYASLLAWVLCIIILGLTLVNFKMAGRWVYYEGQLKG